MPNSGSRTYLTEAVTGVGSGRGAGDSPAAKRPGISSNGDRKKCLTEDGRFGIYLLKTQGLPGGVEKTCISRFFWATFCAWVRRCFQLTGPEERLAQAERGSGLGYWLPPRRMTMVIVGRWSIFLVDGELGPLLFPSAVPFVPLPWPAGVAGCCGGYGPTGWLDREGRPPLARSTGCD